MCGRRIVAGLDAGRHLAVHLCAKALGKGAGAVILVPVERLGQQQPLRQWQGDAVRIGDAHTKSPASFCPPLTMPNSAACLIELTVSPPALARPMICALDPCACNRKEEKSEVVSE